MSRVLGICVAQGELRAVLGGGGRLLWAATAPYASLDDVAPAIGRLAGDLPHATRRARVVLARHLVQLRTVAPAPPLTNAAARRYVAFEANRLFRRNGAPLVTDARVVPRDAAEKVLWAGAVPEPLVTAVVRGCEEAGLQLEALGPASEVLPWVVQERPRGSDLCFQDGNACERIGHGARGVWRSRLLQGEAAPVPAWVAPLAATGERAPILAAAYGATLRRPALDLLPKETKAARARVVRKRLQLTAAVGAALWVAAGAVRVARLEVLGRAVERELGSLQPAVDSAVVRRRDLTAARAALGTIQDARGHRSRALVLLADLTTRLGDRAFLAGFQLSADSTVRLVGYAPQAARVLAQLERAPWVRDVRFEAPVMRERVSTGAGGEDLERFSLIVHLRGPP
ncbi:MAG TPA: PilN domain-containing protein [Gemmatimonadales bacterium]|nr:PilN domain-containing protein [Gemmatimonadales bacterium]